METVGSYEAKTHLAMLLERVARGEAFVITRHGTPVAKLVPIEDRRQQARQVVEEMRELARGQRRGDLDIRALIEEGRS